MLSLLVSCIFCIATRTIPVADATVSKQPDFPQLHGKAFSVTTVICPISPAAPLTPCTISPLAITPPPTPVPSVIQIKSFAPSPAPFHISPSAAKFASLSITTGNPVSTSNKSFSG
ncbi:Uncharacterised protein [Streptococcus pneumoniae]|nr:Uncharacterised protein [Streptococcus pneumoniae]